MSAENWINAHDVIALAALVVSTAALFFARRDRSKEAAEKALKEVAQVLGERIDKIESTGDARHQDNTETLMRITSRLASGDETMKNLPTFRDMDLVRGAIGDVGRDVARLEGALTASTRMTERINQFLMEKAP